MKKVLLLVVCTCLTVATFAQENLTQTQKVFQNNIIKFLKEEGYSPTIDEGSIYFKNKDDSNNHYIKIFNESPFFVIIQRIAGRSLEGEKALDKTKALITCNNVNSSEKAIKVYCTEKFVLFVTEQYIHEEEDFKHSFFRNMKELKKSEKTFDDEYNDL